MFCLPQSTPWASCGSPGSDSFVHRDQPTRARPTLAGERRGRVCERLGERRARSVHALVGPGDREPDQAPAAGGHGDLVAQLAARALAERAFIAELAGSRTRTAPPDPAAPDVVRAERVARRRRIGGDHRRPVVRFGVRHRRRAGIAEDERSDFAERARVLQVEDAGVRRRPRPRVVLDELGVDVGLQRHRPCRRRPGSRALSPIRYARWSSGANSVRVSSRPAGLGQVPCGRSPSRS